MGSCEPYALHNLPEASTPDYTRMLADVYTVATKSVAKERQDRTSQLIREGTIVASTGKRRQLLRLLAILGLPLCDWKFNNRKFNSRAIYALG